MSFDIKLLCQLRTKYKFLDIIYVAIKHLENVLKCFTLTLAAAAIDKSSTCSTIFAKMSFISSTDSDLFLNE